MKILFCASEALPFSATGGLADVAGPIKFLREREIVHYQRFGEGLRILTDRLDSKNFYAFNASFDK